MSDVKRFKLQLVQLLPKLRRFARALTRNIDDADELVQMSCERAILKQDQWLEGSSLDRWIYTLMRNLWFSELRKRKVRQGHGNIAADEQTELRSDPVAEDQIYINQIGQAVYDLPDNLRNVTLLVCVEEHSYRETAEILDIPVGTVMSRLSRARILLGQALRGASDTGRGVEADAGSEHKALE